MKNNLHSNERCDWTPIHCFTHRDDAIGHKFVVLILPDSQVCRDSSEKESGFMRQDFIEGLSMR